MPTEPPSEIVILGAGGHAAVVADALLQARPGLVLRFRDDDPACAASPMLGRFPVAQPCMPEVLPPVIHVAIGNNQVRIGLCRSLAGRLCTVRHPAASVSAFARVGDGCFIASGAVIGPRAVLGHGVIVNHGAVVDHDCVVSDGVHIAPNATLGGAVRIGAGVLVGAGAVILPGVEVGDWARVGAGAVVTRDVPAQATAKGCPAKWL